MLSMRDEHSSPPFPERGDCERQDVDFDQSRLLIRSGKGDKDRDADIPGAQLPNALDRKYPNAGKTLAWH
ncbi:MAG: hypothetical protein P8Y83_02045 [Gammaproteobacteria bacterium]